MLKATVKYYDSINDIAEIEVGDHHLHSGGAASGFCYAHGSFDCVLTEEEQCAVDNADYSEVSDD